MNTTVIWQSAGVLLVILTILIQSTNNTTENIEAKWSQFECGFNSLTPPQIPFSFQFFLISLLFLIFDIEIILVLFFPSEPNSTNNTLILSAFLLILILGLFYEWQNGKVSWSN